MASSTALILLAMLTKYVKFTGFIWRNILLYMNTDKLI